MSEVTQPVIATPSYNKEDLSIFAYGYMVTKIGELDEVGIDVSDDTEAVVNTVQVCLEQGTTSDDKLVTLLTAAAKRALKPVEKEECAQYTPASSEHHQAVDDSLGITHLKFGISTELFDKVSAAASAEGLIPVAYIRTYC